MQSPRFRVLTACRQFFWHLTTALIRHDIASLAAVIAFYVFFSLFPLILLIVYAVSAFAPHYPIDQLVSMVRPYFPALSAEKELIDKNITNLATEGARVGLLSAVTLTWSATSGFIAVQQAMDVIWEGQQRSFITRRLIGFVMLVVLLLLALGSATVMAIYEPLKHIAGLHPTGFFWIHWVHGLSRIVFPLSLFLGCLVFYRYLPSRKLPWWVLITGAMVATIALDKGREMFVWYAAHLVRYQIIYGAVFGVILLLLWMYIGSMMVLFGAEVSVALDKSQNPYRE